MKENYQLICAICGFTSSNLISHLHFKHKIKPTEYKKIYNKEFKTKLTEHQILNYKKSSMRCVEYWIEKGFSLEDAKTKVSNHQIKFSLKSCIEKYGEQNGKIIFNRRQNLWQQSLNSKTEIDKIRINKSKGKNIEQYIKEYGINWIDQYFKSNHKKISNVKKIYENCNSLESLCENLYKLIPWTRIKETIRNSIIIRYIYKIDDSNEEEIIRKCFSNIIDKKNFKNGKYGKCYFYEGNTFRSKAEFEIASFLIQKQIEFKYDRKYPFISNNKNYRYDFYLPKYDYYIEYTGLLRTDNKFDKYKKSISEKKNLILTENVQCLFSNNIELIKKEIMDLQ